MQVEMSKAQLEFLSRDDDHLVMLVTGIGAGKSYVASWYVAKMFCEGHRIIVSAQNFKALSRVLFAEIRKRLDELKFPYTYNKSSMEISGPEGFNGWVVGFSAENPEGILGLSDMDVYVADEFFFCQEDMYNYACDRLRGKNIEKTYIRLISSPNSFDPGAAWAVNLVASNPDKVINASSLDNPFTSQSFKNDLLERYPPGTQLYDQQVNGLLVDSRAANIAIDDRLFTDSRPEHAPGSPVWVGCDLAGAGRDDSVFVAIDEYGFLESKRFHHAETQLLVSELLDWNRKYQIAGSCIDTTGGFGTGLFDYTKRSVSNTEGVNFGSASIDDNYNNMRTWMHFNARKAVSGSSFYMPNFDDGAKIREESRYALYFVDQRGKTAMIPKEDIKKSIGRSPDALDALLLAVKARSNSDGTSGHVNPKVTVNRMLAACG